ncbi:MAG: hypothetical protein WDM79_16505 [Terricaulis sp.]
MRFACALTIAILALSAPAHAADLWGDAEVVDDAALDDMRGGFSVGGVEIGFGAVITTYSDGQMALATQLTWSEAGILVEETFGNLGQTLESLTPEERSALGLDAFAGAGGVVINDETGVTALVHNVTEGALQNVILNTASGRNLSQAVDVTITLPGFEAVQGMLSDELLGLRLDADLSHMLSQPPAS